jgi:predicted nuclease of predicted toxin-antitoxin system
MPMSLIPELEAIGYDCCHVHDKQLSGKPDLTIVEFAEADDWIILTHDLDFSRIISISGRKKPSVITFRLDKISTSIIIDLVRSGLPSLEDKLIHGALVSVSSDKIRYQYLPLTRE